MLQELIIIIIIVIDIKLEMLKQSQYALSWHLLTSPFLIL